MSNETYEKYMNAIDEWDKETTSKEDIRKAFVQSGILKEDGTPLPYFKNLFNR